MISLSARSRIVPSGFGAYGAASSKYYKFLARGQDVVYPKDMGMIVGLGTREARTAASQQPPTIQQESNQTPSK